MTEEINVMSVQHLLHNLTIKKHIFTTQNNHELAIKKSKTYFT